MSSQPEKDRYWTSRAVELAQRGIAVSSPNPAVGCVVLDRAGQVAGEGWHEYDMVGHAEAVALAEANSTPPAQVAEAVFEAIRNDQFYILSQPKWIEAVRLRTDKLLAMENPENPNAMVMKLLNAQQ